MSNACFSSENAPGQHCKNTIRGQFQIPVGGPWVSIGNKNKTFKVSYFKYAASITYEVIYEYFQENVTWLCSCPDYVFNDRFDNKTCCKHIQAVIDKSLGIVRAGGNYEQFKVEQITEQ